MVKVHVDPMCAVLEREAAEQKDTKHEDGCFTDRPPFCTS